MHILQEHSFMEWTQAPEPLAIYKDLDVLRFTNSLQSAFLPFVAADSATTL